MPLVVYEDELTTPDRYFLIFYSSIDDTGKMWCPDCREVEDYVKKTFEESTYNGVIIYVGQRPEWKSPSNKYRISHNIESVPTIVRFENGNEVARLVGEEILEPGNLDFFKKREM